ncbi:MAG: exonuclease SbcCD subunit D [Acidobacteriota bacterium]
MRPFSFVHAADLHLDSPFRGVTAASPRLRKALSSSTFRAFDSLIKTTLESEADFLLLAGDIYDSQDRSLTAQLKLLDGLSKLEAAGIPSFIVHGNHDPLDSRMSALEWPARAHFFGSSIKSLTAAGPDGTPLATVSGTSFAGREEPRNLAARFTRQATGLFQIGLLHCNTGGHPGHENYAPCTLDDLRVAGMDYWALGHVHTRSILLEDPWVVYPGNTQGRHIREQGARGCYHVRVDGNGQVKPEFVALDAVRWSEIEVSIEGMETLDALERSILDRIETEAASADGRALVCRAAISGRGSLHGELRHHGAADQLLERIRERFNGDEPFIWVQSIGIGSRPQADLDAHLGRQDLLAEVLAVSREVRSSPPGRDALFKAALADLWNNPGLSKARLERPADEQIDALLAEAELLCLDLLGEES